LESDAHFSAGTFDAPDEIALVRPSTTPLAMKKASIAWNSTSDAPVLLEWGYPPQDEPAEFWFATIFGAPPYCEITPSLQGMITFFFVCVPDPAFV
jgi:hypothetical protein